MDQRPIKFKAWHMPTKCMFTVHNLGPDYIFDDSLNGPFASPTTPAETKDCIVLQFTGVLDKAGIEIYEHDIVEIPEGDGLTYWAVAFVNGAFELHCEGSTESMDAFEGEMKVVGNTYEDAYLLFK